MNYREEPPYLYILLAVILLNAIFSTYFISILLSGVVFKIFLTTLKKRYYYLVVSAIFAFLNIENMQGLGFFTLTATALILNYIIIPRTKHILSSSGLKEVIYLFLFYCGYLLSNHIPFNFELLQTITINFLLDISIIGFIL